MATYAAANAATTAATAAAATLHESNANRMRRLPSPADVAASDEGHEREGSLLRQRFWRLQQEGVGSGVGSGFQPYNTVQRRSSGEQPTSEHPRIVSIGPHNNTAPSQSGLLLSRGDCKTNGGEDEEERRIRRRRRRERRRRKELMEKGEEGISALVEGEDVEQTNKTKKKKEKKKKTKTKKKKQLDAEEAKWQLLLHTQRLQMLGHHNTSSSSNSPEEKYDVTNAPARTSSSQEDLQSPNIAGHRTPEGATNKKTMPFPRGHIVRTESETQLAEEEATADWHDLCMFQRLVSGIRDSQDRQQERRLSLSSSLPQSRSASQHLNSLNDEEEETASYIDRRRTLLAAYRRGDEAEVDVVGVGDDFDFDDESSIATQRSLENIIRTRNLILSASNSPGDENHGQEEGEDHGNGDNEDAASALWRRRGLPHGHHYSHNSGDNATIHGYPVDQHHHHSHTDCFESRSLGPTTVPPAAAATAPFWTMTETTTTRTTTATTTTSATPQSLVDFTADGNDDDDDCDSHKACSTRSVQWRALLRAHAAALRAARTASLDRLDNSSEQAHHQAPSSLQNRKAHHDVDDDDDWSLEGYDEDEQHQAAAASQGLLFAEYNNKKNNHDHPHQGAMPPPLHADSWNSSLSDPRQNSFRETQDVAAVASGGVHPSSWMGRPPSSIYIDGPPPMDLWGTVGTLSSTGPATQRLPPQTILLPLHHDHHTTSMHHHDDDHHFPTQDGGASSRRTEELRGEGDVFDFEV